MTVTKTSVLPLPACTTVELREHVAAEGQPVTDSTAGFGNGLPEGVTVTSYFAEDPTSIVAGPELLIEKLNGAACTVKATTVFGVSDPDVPMTIIE